MATEGKRRRWRVLLWIVLVLIVIVAGAGGGMYYAMRSGILLQTGIAPIDQILVGMQMQIGQQMARIAGGRAEREAAPPPPREPPPPPPGVRRYRVKEGETLWSIARKSGLVDSPWEWRTIVKQNRDKIDYVFVSAETGEWQVMMASGAELTVRDEAPPPVPTSVDKKFAIQIVTVPASNRQRAYDLVNLLLTDGVYAYLYRNREDEEGGYRVRAGFYESKPEAERVAEWMQKRYAEKGLFTEPFWVTVPSDRELRGEWFDFGVQRVRPWCIELPRRGTHAEALKDLRQAGNISDFPHIAQTQGEAMRFIYNARLGFYATRDEAQAALDKNRSRLPDPDQIRLVAPETFAEVLPGQRFKVRLAGS